MTLKNENLLNLIKDAIEERVNDKEEEILTVIINKTKGQSIELQVLVAADEIDDYVNGKTDDLEFADFIRFDTIDGNKIIFRTIIIDDISFVRS